MHQKNPCYGRFWNPNKDNYHTVWVPISWMCVFSAIIYNSFNKLKKFSCLKMWKTVQKLSFGSFCLSDFLLLFQALYVSSPWNTHTSGGFEDGTVHSSHKVLWGRWELEKPYGVLKFWGTNQNGNLKSSLGNKACVTRNRPNLNIFWFMCILL